MLITAEISSYLNEMCLTTDCILFGQTQFKMLTSNGHYHKTGGDNNVNELRHIQTVNTFVGMQTFVREQQVFIHNRFDLWNSLRTKTIQLSDGGFPTRKEFFHTHSC